MSFAIITDDAADTNPTLLQIPGFYVIQNRVIVEGREHIAGENISREEFIALLESGIQSSTAVAPIADYYKVYQEAINTYSTVLGIHTSSKLSGILNAVHSTVLEFSSEHIFIVDSMSVSVGVTYLIELAMHLRTQNVPIKTVVRILNEAKTKINILVAIGSLDYLYRGGRINSTTFFLTKYLRLKPFIAVKDGLIQKAGVGFGWKGSFKKITRAAKHWFAKNDSPYIAVGQINKNKFASELKATLLQYYGDLPVQETGLSILIINHLGPEALAILLAPNFDSYT